MHAKETRAEWRGAWPTGKLTCVHEHLGGADRADGGERVGERGDGRGQVDDEDGLGKAAGGRGGENVRVGALGAKGGASPRAAYPVVAERSP